MENMSDDICFEDDNEIFSSTCETNVVDGAGLGYQIGLALADMSFRQYAMGEGYYLVLSLIMKCPMNQIDVRFDRTYVWRDGIKYLRNVLCINSS